MEEKNSSTLEKKKKYERIKKEKCLMSNYQVQLEVKSEKLKFYSWERNYLKENEVRIF